MARRAFVPLVSALAVVSVVCSAVHMMFLQLQFPSEHSAAFQPPSHTIERAGQRGRDRDRERGGRGIGRGEGEGEGEREGEGAM